MELQARHIWFPVKVNSRPPPFTPCPVICKPSRKGIHKNVIYKIPGSAGKCYEFAFVRSFSRFEADKYVCSGCRVLRMQNEAQYRNKKVPYVKVAKDQFQTNPLVPENADHFCKPKVLVDVLHAGAMSELKCPQLGDAPEKKSSDSPAEEPSSLKKEASEAVAPSPKKISAESLMSSPKKASPVKSSPKKGSPEILVMVEQPTQRPSPISSMRIFNEHNYASSSNSSRNQQDRRQQVIQFPIFSTEPVYRVPSNGSKKIIFMLPYAKEHCYEFYQRRSRSVYFDVYACAGCNKMKENLGSTVGPVPTVQVRGEYYMTDPLRPKHRHYCTPKKTCEQVVQGEIVRVMQDSSEGSITTLEAVINRVKTNLLNDDGTDNSIEGVADYLRSFLQDKMKMTNIERRYSLRKATELANMKAKGDKTKEAMESASKTLSLAQKEANSKKQPKTEKVMRICPTDEEEKKPPTESHPARVIPVRNPAVFFGLQRRLVISRVPILTDDLKRKSTIPVLYPVKIVKKEDPCPPPPPLFHKDDDFVDVEGC